MKFSVIKERAENETRVALVPETITRLVREGHSVRVESGAGENAGFLDGHYSEVGAEIGSNAADALAGAEVLPVVRGPSDEIVAQLSDGAVVLGLLRPNIDDEMLGKLAGAGLTAFAMELVPRIARAQRADVLSSQASLAGYKAVLIAADTIGKFLPMMMTAAGTIPPARVLILGAGVAGLQAIATARRLGAVVEAFDVRAATKQQVESLGATFVETPLDEDAQDAGGYARQLTEAEQERQREVIADRAAQSDVVITTALIPGRPAPLLLTEAAVKGMRAGSVVVDLAAETGGNCALTEPGETVTREDVIIHGPLNVPGMMAQHASQMYSRNINALLDLFVTDEGAKFDFTDEVVRMSCIAHAGEVVLGEQDTLLPPEVEEETE